MTPSEVLEQEQTKTRNFQTLYLQALDQNVELKSLEQ